MAIENDLPRGVTVVLIFPTLGRARKTHRRVPK
jgi:hypothetical protein